MAKKTNDETIDLLYIKEVPNDKNKKKTKKNKKSTKESKRNDIINLDEELIIGLTPKPEPQKTKKEGKNNKKQENRPKSKSSQKNIKEKTQQ